MVAWVLCSQERDGHLQVVIHAFPEHGLHLLRSP